MLKPIVVPLGGAYLAEYALVPAVALAKRLGAELHLVRVNESDSRNHGADPDGSHIGQTYLQEVSARLEAEVRPELLKVADLEGPVPSALVEYAQAVRARMIVMASRRHAGLHEIVFSSVTDEVIRRAGLPVLVTGPETSEIERHTDWDCERILIPLDGSALSRQIVPHAANLAIGLDARITLLRVVREGVPTVGWPAVPFDREAEGASEERDALADLESVAQVLRDAGVNVDTRVVPTTLATAEAIVNEAFGADLIALATRGHGRAQRFVFGSVAYELTKRMLAPMLVLAPNDARDSEPFVLNLDA